MRLSVVSRTLSKAASEQIRRRIEAGEFRNGQRLPSERELAEQLGISRTVVRESLRGLEASGYVWAEAGRGRFVVDPHDRGKSESLITDWLRRHQAEFRDLVELRSVVEGQALRGASVEPRQLGVTVRELVDAQERAIREGRPEDAADLDYEFHVRLTEVSSNRPLRSLGVALIGRANQSARAAYSMSAYQAESVHQHRLIIEALEAGDLAAAADLVEQHHLSRADRIARHLNEADGRA